MMSNQLWFYNINNLSRYKCAELEMALTSSRPLLVALQETKISINTIQQHNIKNQVYRKITGYTPIHLPHSRCNEHRLCGGISFYISNKINYRHRHDLSIMDKDNAT